MIHRCAWAAAWMLAAGGGLLAQAESRPAFGEGTHVFRRLLHDRGFTPLAHLPNLRDDPASTILLALGDLGTLRSVPGGINGFVAEGGALLIASDQATNDPVLRRTLRQLAGVEITGMKLRCRLEWERLRYRNLDFCPILQPVAGAYPSLFGASEFGGVGSLRVATNLPSTLRVSRTLPGELEVLARLPPGCGTEDGDLLRDLLTSGPRDFAVGGEVGGGRILVLADHSLFINEMMLPADCDNVEFVDNCLTWLSGPEHQRTQVLLLEDGRPSTRFDVPLRSIDLPEGAESAILAMLNRQLLQVGQRLMDLEDTDTFTRALNHRMSPTMLYRNLLLLATLATLVYLAYRVGVRGRHHPELGLPRLAAAVDRQAPADPLWEQRRQALRDGGNLREVGRALARDWLRALGVAPPRPGESPPNLEATGSWWQRRQLRHRLEKIWAWAGSRVIRVRPSDCQQWTRDNQQLDAALARGEARLCPRRDTPEQA